MARVLLELFRLINRGDIKVLGANELACGGVQCGVVLVRSSGAVSNVGESMVQFKPSDARYSSRIWANAFASGLYSSGEAFAIHEAVAVAVLEEASATNDQPPTWVKSGPCTVLQSSAEASNAGTVVEAAIVGIEAQKRAASARVAGG